MGFLSIRRALLIAINVFTLFHYALNTEYLPGAVAVAIRSCNARQDSKAHSPAFGVLSKTAFISGPSVQWQIQETSYGPDRKSGRLELTFAKSKKQEEGDVADLDADVSDELGSDVDYDGEYDGTDEEYDESEEASDSEYDDEEESGGGSFEYNARGELMLPNITRLSRSRVSHNRHKLFKGSLVHLSDLVYPLVVHDKDSSVSVTDVPGLRLLSITDLVKEVEEARNLGLTSFMIYPHIDPVMKSQFADEGLNPDGLLPRAIDAIKEAFPDVQVFADASVSHFSILGHDGLVEPETNYIANDVSVSQVAKQVTTLASSGCDVVSINDTLDGAVGVAREALDFEGFTDVSLMSRAGKFNSVLLNQHNKLLGITTSETVKPETYLHDVAVGDEPILKGISDTDEGADLVAVEPSTSFLDVIRNLKDRLRTPIVAVHTTGEYKALKAAAKAGVYEEKDAALETMRNLKRAGADVIISSFAKDVAQWLLEDMQTNGINHVSIGF